jgi:hypothetical protein
VKQFTLQSLCHSDEGRCLSVEPLLSGKKRLEAPPEANSFAKAEREGKAEMQEEML